MTNALLSFLYNGVEVSGAPVGSRALHYGDGVFRTLLRYQGEVIDAAAQLGKLAADGERIGLKHDLHLLEQLRGDIDRVAADVATAVLKLMLVRGGGGRGYGTADAPTDRYVMAYQPPHYPMEYWGDGVVLERSSFVLGDQPALAGIKHLNRLEQVLAYQSAPADAQEVLVGNARGEWISGGRSNVFIVRGNTLLTPSLEKQGVSGRMRERVLAAAETLGIECLIGTVTDSEIATADELFLTNSVIGIWPVRRFAVHTLVAPGRITRQLMQALAHPRLT